MPYFTPTDIPAFGRARSDVLDENFNKIKSAFDSLPTETELKTYTGNYGTDSGAADAYVITLPYAPAAYADGMEIVFKAANTNTGSSTVNVSGLGVKSILRQNGVACQAGDIDGIVSMRYNATLGGFTLSIPNAIQGVNVSSFMTQVLTKTDPLSVTKQMGLVFESKAQAVAFIDANGITNGQAVIITSSDGGAFVGVTGAAPGTYADNGGSYCGTQFILTGGDGSSGVVRQLDGFVTPQMFGAVADGVSDDTAAMQAAYDAAVTTGRVYLPSGTYLITDTVYIGVTAAGTVLRNFILTEGESKDTTIIEGNVVSKPVLYASNPNVRSLTLKGQGKGTGNGDVGLSFHTGASVRDIELYDMNVTAFDGTGIRLSSAYNGKFKLLRVTLCTNGILFDDLGPWGLGTTTFTIDTSYIAACTLGLGNTGVSTYTIRNLTVESCTVGLDMSTATLIAERLYREGNTTAGVYAVNMLGYVDIEGTAQNVGDQDSITFFTGVRGKVTSTAAPRQDISTVNFNELGHTYFDDGTRLFHVLDAKGSAAGLRDKYPQVKMTPSIRVDAFVKSNGSILTEDTVGLTITHTATGTYTIAWGSTFDIGVTAAKLPLVSVSAVAGNHVGTANPRLANWQYVGPNVAAFNVAESLIVYTYDLAGTLTDCAFTLSIDFRLGSTSGTSPNFNDFGEDTTA